MESQKLLIQFLSKWIISDWTLIFVYFKKIFLLKSLNLYIMLEK